MAKVKWGMELFVNGRRGIYHGMKMKDGVAWEPLIFPGGPKRAIQTLERYRVMGYAVRLTQQYYCS